MSKSTHETAIWFIVLSLYSISVSPRGMHLLAGQERDTGNLSPLGQPSCPVIPRLWWWITVVLHNAALA